MIEFFRLSAHFAIWFTYDPIVKAELFSTAYAAGNRLTLIDPIALPTAHRDELDSIGRVALIVVTNANHLRDTLSFAQAYSARVFAPSELNAAVSDNHVLSDGLQIGPLQTIKIDGAAAGEFALYHANDGGTLVVGDALINFEPHGFGLLPKKYCSDQIQMIRSLRRLLDFNFNRIFFAHGHPIMTRARDRLALLLDS
jgi:glyoxylase-like metal-dependent hydrolase (beta-lactamase superfamily II)